MADDRPQPASSEGLQPAQMAQLFRGELWRSERWRARLDSTTHWAIATTAIVLGVAFASPAVSPLVMIAGLWLVLTFLGLEARRYRYYDLWNRRVRLIEGGYWAALLRREPVDPDAIRELAQGLARPQLELSFFGAVTTRLRRGYGPILVANVIGWFVKLSMHPRPVTTWAELEARAKVGFLSGRLVVSVLLAVSALVILAWAASFLGRAPLGELRPRPRSRTVPLWQQLLRPYPIAEHRRRARAGPEEIRAS